MPASDPLYPERDRAARAEGERRRDEAMGRVEEHAPLSWKWSAEEAVRYIAMRRAELTTDAPKAVLRVWGVPQAPEERAWGPIMKAAAKAGWIEKTTRTHKSVEPDCHRRDKAVWRSRLYVRPV